MLNRIVARIPIFYKISTLNAEKFSKKFCPTRDYFMLRHCYYYIIINFFFFACWAPFYRSSGYNQFLTRITYKSFYKQYLYRRFFHLQRDYPVLRNQGYCSNNKICFSAICFLGCNCFM